MRRKILVIGGGPAGMLSAISAARNGAEVVLLERNPMPGKKLSATGNGRCNFTNRSMPKHVYRGDDLDFAWKVLDSFGSEETVHFFSELGVETKWRDTYAYPQSDEARSVTEALCDELKRLDVQVVCNIMVKDIRVNKSAASKGQDIHKKHSSKKNIPKANGSDQDGYRFTVFAEEAIYPKATPKKGRLKPERFERRIFFGDTVILCTGSKAAPSTGSDGSGYRMAEHLGHHIVPVVPALTGIRCHGSQYASLAGIRTDATVSCYVENLCAAVDTGELQLTDYGISGIPVFQIERFVAKALLEKKPCYVEINFLPGKTDEEAEQYFFSRKERLSERTIGHFFTGLFHEKLGAFFLSETELHADRMVSTLKKRDIQALCHVILHYTAKPLEVNDFSMAQSAAGGVDTREVDPFTMESKRCKGIYLAGELLDIDGKCGGYNLQFAFATGMIAGRAASIAK